MEKLTKVEELKKEITPVINAANGLIVETADQYASAGEFLKRIKGRMAQVDEVLIEPLRETKRNITQQMKNLDDIFMVQLKKAESKVKSKMLHYDRIEEEKRLKEQRRLQAEAEEKARKERERLFKAAEKLKTPELKEERIAEAEEVEAPQVTVQKEVPKVSGISTRKKWRGKVVNRVALIKFCLDQSAFLYLIDFKQNEIDKYAQSTKGEFKMAGVEFYEESILSSRGE